METICYIQNYPEKNFVLILMDLGDGWKEGLVEVKREGKSGRGEIVILSLGRWQGLYGCACMAVALVILISAKMKCTFRKKESLLWRRDESGVPVNLWSAVIVSDLVGKSLRSYRLIWSRVIRVLWHALKPLRWHTQCQGDSLMYFECQEKNVNYGVICTLVLKINVGHNAFSFRITRTWESLGK